MMAHGLFNVGGIDIGDDINRIGRPLEKSGRFIEKGRAPPIGVEELAERMRILRRAELRQCAAKGGKFQPPLRLKRVPVGGGEQGLKLPAPKPGDGPGRGFAAGLPDPPADRLDDRASSCARVP